jgi:gentisate 1,2-dioxygenase
MQQPPRAPAPDSDLQAYYEELRSLNTGPLWVTTGGNPPAEEPRSRAVPYAWHWKDLRPLLMKSGELAGMEIANRRVLRLLNPGIQERRATTNRLFAGLQLVLPGEVAKTHRHTPAALRFVVEGKGGYTTVDGERLAMWPGDLILTPNWTWHDHWNDTDTPMVWIDGLDIVLVELLEANFFEPYGEDMQPVSRPMGSSLAKYGSGGLRPAWESHQAPHSALLHYPWRQTREALDRLAGLGEGSPYDGIVLEYTDPATGGPVMPTIACHVQMLRPGERTQAHRHTPSAIYHVVEGEGYSVAGGQRLDWAEKDIFAVPGWTFHEHANASATRPAVLFSYTEAPAMRALGLLREEALTSKHQ